MKKQFVTIASMALISAPAVALDLGAKFDQLRGSLGEEKPSFAEYNYAQGTIDFLDGGATGFSVDGSFEVMPNIAVMGGLSRVSTSELNVDYASTTVELGARYFFALQSLPNTDLDLSASLVNRNEKVDAPLGLTQSDNDAGLLLKGQVRHLYNKQIADTAFELTEAFGGATMATGSGSSFAAQGGAVVAINEQFSAVAEMLLDDGINIFLGARMTLGKPQLNPGSPKVEKVEAVTTDMKMPEAELEAPVIAPATEPMDLELKSYGLSEEEMADLEAAVK